MEENRRVQYSKKALRDALVELLKTKSISSIRITELCKLANVNRGTFYAYYETPYQLLDSIEEELFTSVMVSLDKYAPQKNIRGVLLEVFTIIENNKELCRVILSDLKEHSILNRLLYGLNEKSMQNWILPSANSDKKSMSYMFSFMVEGTIGIVKKWLNEKEMDDKEFVIDIVLRNIHLIT